METNQSTYITAVNIKVSKPSNQITELSSLNPSPIVNTIDITPENDNISTFPQKIETRNQIVEFLKYSKQRSNLLKKEFVNFLLKDDNFTDLNEPEKFLREKAIENINIINKNNLEITKKKEDYQKIILELNREINNHFQLSMQEEEENYIKRKEELEKEIKRKKHELGALENAYREEYKKRYLIVQQQKNEVQNIKINSKQYEKYNILNKKISFESNQKENLLNDIKKYMEQSHKIFSEEIDNKAKIYKELELEVNILKQNTEDIEKSLKSILEKRSKVNSLIEKNIENNSSINYSLENIRNDYFLNKIILLRNTEMNNINLEDLIDKYKEIKTKIINTKKVIFNTNQQITQLNENLHKLNNEYNKKKENYKILIKQNKKINKVRDNDAINSIKDKKLVRDKLFNIKKNNKDRFLKANSKTNLLIFCYKFLFDSSNILFNSFENSRIDFYFDLEQKNKNYNDIINSNYYELIKINQNYIDKKFTTNEKILESPKKFLIFGFKIFLFYVSATNLMLSNVFNLSCFNNQDFIDRLPLSQFNIGIFSFKENENKNINESKNDIVIKKENNKVIIQNFFSQDNKNKYFKHLKSNSSFLSKRKEIMSKKIDDMIKMNKVNNKTELDNHTKKKNPKQIFTNFLENMGIPEKIKNSRYIKYHQKSSLLSLKRFFCEDDQNNLFTSRAVNLKNNSLTNSRNNERNKFIRKSFDKDNSLQLLKKKKNKNLNDDYLIKEYNYEIETDDNKKIIKKKKLIRNRRQPLLNFAGQDPQKQLIFSRMLDIRNLELKSSNINSKTTLMNDITDEKKRENKFYEMYDKFKKKYFFNSKKSQDGFVTNDSFKDIINTKSGNNNFFNLNLKKGMKFIRNNSDFYLGKKGNNSIKNKYKKFELPNINNKDKNNHNDNSKIDHS